jgi:maltooligosyltrehalose trehalohydrolase
MRFGADWRCGVALFRLWAPAAASVVLRIAEGPELEMQALPGGWWQADHACAPGTRYRFVLPDGLAIPDPASRAQHGGVHGWSVVVDPLAYRWQQGFCDRPWHEAVIWEAHVGVLGGYEGLRARLPELAGLGITAIELMPLADFPGERNWGYDGVLQFAPAAAYGTPDQLKALIDEAHGLGLMMLLDVVYNHFGPDGNYLNRTAPQFFREGSHTSWGEAIDFARPEVAEFFTQNALYWLGEYRFDGLRLDAVQAILPYAALPALGRAIRTGVGPDRAVHLIVENERNDADLLGGRPFDAQWNDDLHHCLHVLLTGETEAYYADYAESPAEKLARCLHEGFAYQGEVSVNLGHPRGTASGALPPTAFVNFVQNHDHVGNRAFGERLLALADPEAVRAALALVLLCPQIPMLFMGEESGSRSPFLFFTDHHDELADAVREGRRAEFRRFAAFADPASRARIPDPNAEASFTASIPRPAAEGDWPGFVCGLLAARATHIVPHLPGTTSLAAAALGPAAVHAAWRLGNGDTLVLACNLGNTALPLILPEGVATGAATVIAATALAPPGILPPRATIALVLAA